MADEWLSDEELQAAMDLERNVYGKEILPKSGGNAGTTGTARRLFAENAAVAANSIIRIAQHGATEKIRFDAAKYVLERGLGPAGKAAPVDDTLDPLEATLQELQRGR